MKRNIFIKHSHEDGTPLIVLIYTIFALVSIPKSYEIPIMLLIFIVIFFPMLIKICINSGNIGMYIDRKDIYYKYRNSKIKISVDDIKGVKICKYRHNMFNRCIYNKYNKNLYSCVFLKRINNEMLSYNNNIEFAKRFSKDIICITVYDKELIEYIKYLKPNLVVLSEKDESYIGQKKMICIYDRYFISRYYKHKWNLFIAGYMIVLGIILYMIYGISMRILISWSIIYILTYLNVIWSDRMEKCGLYIEKDYIYYYGIISRKKIFYNEIKGIKITKSKTGSTISKYIKNEKGDFLYSIILLRDIDNDMKEFDFGDYPFCTKYSKRVLSMTIYDSDLINYIKEKNPDVIIMSDMI